MTGKKPFKIYVGYDLRDELAFRACVASLQKHSSIPLEIIPLKDHELRRKRIYWRTFYIDPQGQRYDERDGKPFSTEFSFTRFAIPLFDKTDEWVLFCDADMLWRKDVAELLKLADDKKAIMCVPHNHTPAEGLKFDGMKQERYFRKNWSSFMLMRPNQCKITPYIVNNQSGSFLHSLLWQPDSDIGFLPDSWNWLEGWSDPNINPDVVHFTRGTPDMLGNDLPYSKEWWEMVNAWTPEMNTSGIDNVKQAK